MREYGRIWTAKPKVLVSRTRTEAAHDTRIIGADGRALEAIAQIRAETEGEIGVGGATLATQLLREGLLDERFFMYTEDVDLCARVRARGHRVLFVPDAEIVHLRGRSAATAPRATRLAYRRSHLAFYRKHHPGWAKILEIYLRIRGEWPPPAS
jgi:GT2 family glycosyltransferase